MCDLQRLSEAGWFSLTLDLGVKKHKSDLYIGNMIGLLKVWHLYFVQWENINKKKVWKSYLSLNLGRSIKRKRLEGAHMFNVWICAHRMCACCENVHFPRNFIVLSLIHHLTLSPGGLVLPFPRRAFHLIFFWISCCSEFEFKV